MADRRQIAVEGDGIPLAPVRSAFETAVQLLEAGRASLLLRDSGADVLTVAASIGIEPGLAASIRVPVGEGIAGLVVEEGIPLLGMIDHQTFLSVPVITEHGVEGALNVTERTGGKRYTVQDIAAATSAAGHIGHLIQYGRYAARDPVSGLPNRRAFEEMLERELALSNRMGRSFTVVFLDLDNLKHINDHFGHAKGDEVIHAVGDTLQHILRPYDFAGRFGGDEFILLLSETGELDQAIGERIIEAVARLSQNMRVPISTSLGIAHCPADGTDGTQLVALADARMYEQKRRKKSALP